jgi:aspartate/methionine/tyrosine aminotransferase
VLERAKKYLAAAGSIGAYTDSMGLFPVREEVAAFLQARDGVAADPGTIFLTNGASDGVRFLMKVGELDKLSKPKGTH